MEKMKQILMIVAPFDDLEQLETLREQICVGLREGVVVLPEGADYQVVKVPVRESDVQLSPEYYAAVDELFEDGPGQDDPEPEKDMDVGLHGGRCAEEKRAIQLKLQAYRRDHGLGCWCEVAEASDGAVSPEILRDMANGTGVYPVSLWRKAETALIVSTINCKSGEVLSDVH